MLRYSLLVLMVIVPGTLFAEYPVDLDLNLNTYTSSIIEDYSIGSGAHISKALSNGTKISVGVAFNFKSAHAWEDYLKPYDYVAPGDTISYLADTSFFTCWRYYNYDIRLPITLTIPIKSKLEFITRASFIFNLFGFLDGQEEITALAPYSWPGSNDTTFSMSIRQLGPNIEYNKRLDANIYFGLRYILTEFVSLQLLYGKNVIGMDFDPKYVNVDRRVNEISLSFMYKIISL